MLLLYFLRLALRRLRSRLGLTTLSLLGVVLSIGLVASIPMFTQGVSFTVLRDELDALGRLAQRPPFAVRVYFNSSEKQPLSLAASYDMENIIAGIMRERVGLPIERIVTRVESPSFTLRPARDDRHYVARSDNRLKQLTFTVLEGIGDHIVAFEGEPFGEPKRDDRLPVWIHEALSYETGLQAGESYDMYDEFSGHMVPIYVAGIWRAKDRSNTFWYSDPSDLRDNLMVSRSDYEINIQNLLPQLTGFNSWYLILDENALSMERADTSAQGLETTANIVSTRLPGARMDYSPLEPLQRYLQRKATLSALLVGFSIPALGLLFYFLSLISTITVQYQKEETAIMASRGAGRTLILGLATFETLLMIGVGILPGLGLGYVLAQLMGYSLSFLTFISRQPLPLSITGVDQRLLGAALLMLVVARLIPAFQASRESVVTHLQRRSRAISTSGLLKVGIDLLLVVVTAYAYQQLSHRGTLGVISWEPKGDPFSDPLLLLAPSLFVLTASLVMGHLFPLFMRPVDRLSASLRAFAPYMGLRHLVRQSAQYTGALFLVVVCLSLGAFYSSMGLSLDQWLRDRIYYQTGADYTFKHGLKIGLESGPSTPTVQTEGGWLLPISDYLKIPGVTEATRVGDYDAFPRVTRSVKARFLGLDRLDFPQVVYFRDDFARVSIEELMNRLGMYNNGLLVSRKFLSDNNLFEGQPVQVEVAVESSSERHKVDFVIVGTFDHWPTMLPERKGGMPEVFVGNLDYLFDQVGGIYLHSIWMNTEPGVDTKAILKSLEQMGVEVAYSSDTRHMIVEDEDRVERVGLFGVLSIGFLAGSILSCVGLLVYTYASLQGRLQQLSILRAIGVQTHEVLAMVGFEYAGVIIYGVLGGVAVGVVASHLYVPFFQFSSDPALAVPPFLPEIAWSEIAWIAAIFAGALVLSQLLILMRVTQKDIFQVLRMGQRE